MRVRRFGGAIGVAAALSLVMSACGSDTEATDAQSIADRVKESKKITIGVKYDQPSLGLKTPDGGVEGYDVDVAKYVAKQLGVPEEGITFKETRSANRETFIKGGQVDLVFATYSITESRKKQVTFGGPYYVAHQDTMVRADDDSIQKTADLKGKKLCKAAGSNSYRRVIDPPPDGKLDIDATPVAASSYSECIAKLKGGDLDAVTTDDLILAGFAKQQEGEFRVINDPFTDEKYGIGMRKGDTETCEAVNAAVTKMYEDGTAAKLLDKWFSGTGLELVKTVPQFEGCS